MSNQADENNENQKTETPPKESISDFLKWIADRGGPLFCILLFVSILFLYQFIGYYKIPISISSPTFIASLPVIFGFLAFFIFSIVGFLFSPAMILLTPIKKTKEGKIIELLKGKKIIMIWVFFYIISGLLIYLLIELMDFIGFLSLNYYPTLIVFIIPPTITLLIVRFQLKIKTKEISSDFYMMTIFSSFFQILVTLIILLFIIDLTSEELIYPKIIVTCFSLSVIQIIIAKTYTTLINSEKKLTNIAITCFLTIVLISLQPYAAAQLTSKVLEFTITGGRSCVVLTLVDDFPKENLIRKSKDSMHSINLRIYTETDGVYMAREAGASNDSAIHFIPRSFISGMDSCGKEAPTTHTYLSA